VETVHRAGLIGDVHGQVDALQMAIEFLHSQPNLDAIFCTGDFPTRNKEPGTEEVCRIAQQADLIAIRGNHDRWRIGELDGNEVTPLGTDAYLADLPVTITFPTPRGTAMLCHGINKDDMNAVYRRRGDGREQTLHLYGLTKLELFMARYPQIKILIHGHTHLRDVAKYGEMGELVVINAGTLLHQRFLPTVGIIDFDAGTVQFYEIDIDGKNVTLGEEFAL
jgi:predicted phosphodiesterase